MEIKSILDDSGFKSLLSLALEEDIGSGDQTTRALIDPSLTGIGEIVAKEKLVVCGLPFVAALLQQVDETIKFDAKLEEGSKAKPGEVIAELRGSCASLLTAERVALNILQHLSGIATATSKIARTIKDYNVSLLDTRKTTPGWRKLEKYAVYVGGGKNHRMGLYDAILIKNNHIDIIGGDVKKAILLAREAHAENIKIEVEVRDMRELEAAIAEGPDAILFDNFSPEDLTSAVNFLKTNFIESNAYLEASGGINESNVVEYAKTGVNGVSMGSLTHSVRAVDISLKIKVDV